MSLYTTAITELRGSLERDDLDDDARAHTYSEIETLLDLEAEELERDAIEYASAEAAAFAERLERESREQQDRESRLADLLDHYHY